MKSDGDENVPILNGWNTHTYRVEMQHLRERIAMGTDWVIVLSTSQYIPLDGAVVHDVCVYHPFNTGTHQYLYVF